VIERLSELLDLPVPQEQSYPQLPEADAVLDLGGHTFAIEWKGSGAAAHVALAAEQVRDHAAGLGDDIIPLVAVPFMGPVGRDRCEKAGVAWLDLSGNARIAVPGLRVLIDGQPNRFKRPGKPASAFAPKSARIARWLLMHPSRSVTQRELARATDMDEGFTSRIVAKLEHDELVTREHDGAVRVRDPDLLLDAWQEDYDFSKHQILRGHMPARSGDTLLRLLSEKLREAQIPYAATGLPAAWLLTRFAAFRIVTVYLAAPPWSELLERLGVRDEARGANVWLVEPNDDGVFHGAGDRDGIRCVHPVQAYLDLAAQPERAKEAAEHLRSELLSWSSNG
jgi:hypothetical protein